MKYKEYGFIEVKRGDYIGKIYKDNMFGMEFTNFSLYDKGGREIFHATLDDAKEYTKEDVKKLMDSASILMNKNF